MGIFTGMRTGSTAEREKLWAGKAETGTGKRRFETAAKELQAEVPKCLWFLLL